MPKSYLLFLSRNKCSLSYLWLGLSIFFHSICLGSEVSIVSGYNPIPSVEKDVEILSSKIDIQFSELIKVRAGHYIFFDNKKFNHGYSGSSRIGSANRLYLDFSYEYSQSDSYFPQQHAVLTLMIRLPETPVAGFYEYSEKRYAFTIHRHAAVKVGHYKNFEWLIGGFAVDHYENKTPQIHVVIELENETQLRKNSISAKLRIGQHHRIKDNMLMVPSFGVNAAIDGDIGLVPTFKQLKFIYQYRGSLLRSAYRTGLSVGIKYIF